jgi:DNA repair protein RecO (recombination protein O)
LSGDALLSGYYVNELLLHFLHRHDPQPEIFDIYVRAIEALGATDDVAPCLRQFEIALLGALGYALNLDHEADSQEPLQADLSYQYRFEQGAVRVARSEGQLVFTGAVLMAIANQRFEEAEVLRAANRLLREVIGFHLGGKELKSRKVLVELHRQRNSSS